MKTALGVVVGYLVMFVVIFVVFTGLYVAIGADRAFRPGTYDVSTLWLVASFAVSLAAAVAGGRAAAAIGGGSAVRVLAGLVFVLGIVMAWPALSPETDPRSNVRMAEVGTMEAMSNARQPPWVAMTVPVIGAVGALAGGRRARPRG